MMTEKTGPAGLGVGGMTAIAAMTNAPAALRREMATLHNAVAKQDRLRRANP